MSLLKRLVKEEAGQGMIEYVIIAAGISICAILIIRAIGPKVNTVWQNVNSAL